MEQLLAVLPAESVAALPIACRPLMIDPSSPIFDLYGSDAPIDPNGKHLPWLWVLLLPFVDEKRVVKAFNEYKRGLTVEECRRNAFGVSLVFLHSNHKLAVDSLKKIRYRPVEEIDGDVLKALRNDDNHNSLLSSDLEKLDECHDDIDNSTGNDVTVSAAVAAADNVENKNEDKNEDKNIEEIIIQKSDNYIFDHSVGDGISGTLSAPPMKWFIRTGTNATITAPPTPPPQAFHDLKSNQVICLTYESPREEPGSHKSQLLSGVILQESILTSFDLMARRPPRLNRGGFNIIELALGLKNKNGGSGGNQNNILRYGNERGGDGGGHYPNQRQFSNNNNNNNNNSGSQPQQFLQHFQQQQQQFSNNGYGYNLSQKSQGRDGRNDNNNNYNNNNYSNNNNNNNNNNRGSGYGGGNYDKDYDDRGGNIGYNNNNHNNNNNNSNNKNNNNYHQMQNQNQNTNQGPHYRHTNYGDSNQGRAYPQHPPPQHNTSGYQQQQQYNGSFLTASSQPQQQNSVNGNGRFSFSTNGSGGNRSGLGPVAPSGVSYDSMESMRAQLAQTLQQQQKQGGGNGAQMGIMGSFSSIGNRPDNSQNQQGLGQGQRGARR